MDRALSIDMRVLTWRSEWLLRGYVGGRSAYAPLHIRGARPRVGGGRCHLTLLGYRSALIRWRIGVAG